MMPQPVAPVPPVLPSFTTWVVTSFRACIADWIASQDTARVSALTASLPLSSVQAGWAAATDAQRAA